MMAVDADAAFASRLLATARQVIDDIAQTDSPARALISATTGHVHRIRHGRNFVARACAPSAAQGFRHRPPSYQLLATYYAFQ